MSPIELRSRREALGLSQQGLAECLGVKQATVSAWEKGTRVIPDGISERIDALEDHVETLIDQALDGIDQAEDLPGPPMLFVWPTNQAYWAAHPESDGHPAVLHRVAMARARTLADTPDINLVTPPDKEEQWDSI